MLSGAKSKYYIFPALSCHKKDVRQTKTGLKQSPTSRRRWRQQELRPPPEPHTFSVCQKGNCRQTESVLQRPGLFDMCKARADKSKDRREKSKKKGGGGGAKKPELNYFSMTV